MSFFNVFGDDPPIVILGIAHRPDGTPKDTTRNIRDTGEFVVNLVNAPLARRMVDCAIDFPPELDELTETGLSTRDSRLVGPNRIAEAPAALECRVERIVEYRNRSIVFGEVVYMHVDDRFIDPETLYVRAPEYSTVARLHADWYITADAPYELPKPSYEEWLAQRGPSAEPREA